MIGTTCSRGGVFGLFVEYIRVGDVKLRVFGATLGSNVYSEGAKMWFFDLWVWRKAYC